MDFRFRPLSYNLATKLLYNNGAKVLSAWLHIPSEEDTALGVKMLLYSSSSV